MGRDSAKTFADRLPEVVPKREEDIAHLSDEMAELLYPGRRRRPFRMGVVFDNFGGPNYPRALEIARRSSVYREIGSGASMRHQAEFDATEARTMRDLYNIVGEIHTTEVLVEGRRVPYAREIWLPLYWIFVNGEASA